MELKHIMAGGIVFGLASLAGGIWLFVWAVNKLAGGE